MFVDETVQEVPSHFRTLVTQLVADAIKLVDEVLCSSECE
jgi:hypothetical protein